MRRPAARAGLALALVRQVAWQGDGIRLPRHWFRRSARAADVSLAGRAFRLASRAADSGNSHHLAVVPACILRQGIAGSNAGTGPNYSTRCTLGFQDGPLLPAHDWQHVLPCRGCGHAEELEI